MNVPIELLSLDAGGVLVFPNFERISDTFARHGIRVSPDALRAADPHGRFAVDTAVHVAVMNDADRGSMYFRVMFERAGIPADAPVAKALDELWSYHSAHNLWEYVPPDVAPALEALRARGLRLVVVSNANGTLRAHLDRIGMTRRFDVVLDSADEGVEKPDPRFFEIALEKSGASRDTTIHVGDLYYVDVMGARAAGLRGILLDEANLRPDADCPRVQSLDELVEKIEAGEFD